jgi:hypothetical protein
VLSKVFFLGTVVAMEVFFKQTAAVNTVTPHRSVPPPPIRPATAD